MVSYNIYLAFLIDWKNIDMPRRYRRRPRPATWRRVRRTGGGTYAQRRWTREEEDLLIQTWNSGDN